MKNKYGFEDESWEKAKSEAKNVLIGKARHNDTIIYSELAQQINAIKLEAHDQRFFYLLGEISSEEDKDGRGMLTAIVVHQNGDGLPGQGFFDLANSLGRDASNKVACWTKELKRVYDYWANQPKDFLAMTEIEAKFDSEWVLVEDPLMNDTMEIQGGRVLFHSGDRDAVYREAAKTHPKKFAMLYVGKIPKDTAIVL